MYTSPCILRMILTHCWLLRPLAAACRLIRLFSRLSAFYPDRQLQARHLPQITQRPQPILDLGRLFVGERHLLTLTINLDPGKAHGPRLQ